MSLHEQESEQRIFGISNGTIVNLVLGLPAWSLALQFPPKFSLLSNIHSDGKDSASVIQVYLVSPRESLRASSFRSQLCRKVWGKWTSPDTCRIILLARWYAEIVYENVNYF